MTMMYIGMANTYHDSALALVDDQGRLLFAEATERYLQNKRALHCPADTYGRILRLLKRYGTAELDLVLARSWTDAYHRELGQQLAGPAPAIDAAQEPAFVRLQRQKLQFIDRSQYFAQAAAGLGSECAFHEAGFRGSISQRNFDHHLTHAAAACYSSNYPDAVCAVVDGFGEGSSTAFFHYRAGRLEPIVHPGARASTASLGMFYAFLCVMCGFDMHEGEEWKVMGLAPYGRLDPELYDVFDQLLVVDGLTLAPGNPVPLAQYYEAFCAAGSTHDRDKAANVACTGQQIFSDKLCQLLRNLYALGLSDRLILGGGCALNSTTNGLITSQTPFRNMYAFCAPADDGNAVGAALLAFHHDHPAPAPRSSVQTPYLGSRLSDETLRNVVRFGRLEGLEYCPGTVCQRAADLLSRGAIIGWLQGAAEFGPRALGNRSILADPRRAEIKDEINARVKFREEYRPFAPSILHEYGPEYFVDYQESPYMERTLMFRDAVKARVPGVVHVNGSGRLQTVKREWNERYYMLIDTFRELTGVPLVLNTSFNVMGKPIAHSVEDALAVFHTTGLDALVLEDYLLMKRGAP
jgi:carbamoyltransferase